jgi:formate/nitrite transporter FocA (FNT family)
MSEALNPAEIFDGSAEEGARRPDQGTLELVSTGFIAGSTIAFGIIALAIVEALARPIAGELSRLLGALAFGIGIVFLIVGRAELFSEHFFDPIAAAFNSKRTGMARKIIRLWIVTLVLNLIGGGLMVLILSVEGTLPAGAPGVLNRLAEDIAARHPLPCLMRSIVGGALVALLSFLVIASQSATGRVVLAYSIGVLLALGPFDHVVVSLLHLTCGLVFGASIGSEQVVEVAAISVVGNLLGGVGLVTLSHAAQAKGSDEH